MRDGKIIADRHRVFELGGEQPAVVGRIDARIDGGEWRDADRSPGGAGAAIVLDRPHRIDGRIAAARIGGERKIDADFAVPFGRQRLFQRDVAAAIRAIGAHDIEALELVDAARRQRLARNVECKLRRIERQRVLQKNFVFGAEGDVGQRPAQLVGDLLGGGGLRRGGDRHGRVDGLLRPRGQRDAGADKRQSKPPVGEARSNPHRLFKNPLRSAFQPRLRTINDRLRF